MRRLLVIGTCIALASAAAIRAVTAGQQQPVPGDGCSIETINGKPWPPEPAHVTAIEDIVVTGWAVDPRAHRVPLNLRLRLVPSHGAPVEVPVRHRLLRRDLIALWHTDAYLAPGFTVTLPSQTLESGIWRMSLVYGTGDQEVVCASTGALDVTHAKPAQ
jgi:hypothetical protein